MVNELLFLGKLLLYHLTQSFCSPRSFQVPQEKYLDLLTTALTLNNYDITLNEVM